MSKDKYKEAAIIEGAGGDSMSATKAGYMGSGQSDADSYFKKWVNK